MLPTIDIPTINEWVVLLQDDPVSAKKLMIAIKARNKMQGLFADPSLTLSLEEYERAQQLLEASRNDPVAAAKLAHATRLGRALLGPYPDRAAWLALLQNDPAFAHSLSLALRTREAMLGPQAPQVLLHSIALYNVLKAQQQE